MSLAVCTNAAAHAKEFQYETKVEIMAYCLLASIRDVENMVSWFHRPSIWGNFRCSALLFHLKIADCRCIICLGMQMLGKLFSLSGHVIVSVG